MTFQKLQIGALGLGLLGIAFLPIAINHHSKYLTKRAKIEFEEFNEAELNGKIKSVGFSASGSHFRIQGDSTKYFFSPTWNSDLPNQFFYKLASKGDSVSKESKGEFIYLYHNEEEYKFRFKKF
ncbi:MAG: hypothetical protein AAF388_15020 [Bacteroidota bacterium]